MLADEKTSRTALQQRPSPDFARRSASPTDWRRKYVALMRWSDALTVFVTLAGAQLARFRLENADLHLGVGFSIPYWSVGLALGIAWWLHLELQGAHEVRLIGFGLEETRQVVHSSIALFSAVAIASFALNIPMAPGYVLLALSAGISLLALGRFVVRDQLRRDRVHGRRMSPTLVVGCTVSVIELVQFLRMSRASGFDASAVYAPLTTQPPPPEFQLVRLPHNTLAQGEQPSVEGILVACRENGIQTVVLSSSVPLSTREVRHLSCALTDERIRLILDTSLTDIAGPQIHMQQVAGLPLVHMSTPRMSHGAALVKRVMDVVGSAVAVIALSPVLAVLALIIKQHDGGPVLHAHKCVDVAGRRFQALKFRTTRVDAAKTLPQFLVDAHGKAPPFTVENDPRVTAPGRWMRKYSFDELPQFVNVLKGEMSLVGPRPPLATEVEAYEDYVRRRLRVKPGITGLWQVSGRSDLDWEQTVRLDLYYVENWSPIQDLIILVRTVKAVVAPGGAY